MEDDYLKPRLDKSCFSISSPGDEQDDKNYWHSRTPDERLQYMQLLRQINYGDQASARLQRVFDITKLKSG